MARCEHYETCGRDDPDIPESGACVLHSTDRHKDRKLFEEALEAHWKGPGREGKFAFFVFLDPFDFSRKGFSKEGDFQGATFVQGANFAQAEFPVGVNFRGATFEKKTTFSGAKFGDPSVTFREATFSGEVDFTGAMFAAQADFSVAILGEKAKFDCATFSQRASFREAKFQTGSFSAATFKEEADFQRAEFHELAIFSEAIFCRGTDFSEAAFSGKAQFFAARFSGHTLFASRPRENAHPLLAFSDVDVDFRNVTIDPLDGLSLREVDLRRWLFEDTDLRKAEITGARWANIPSGYFSSRFGVYDERAALAPGTSPHWSRLERLYRELKQNYEDRRDYERASDFHYGEKEMRRRNPATPVGLRFLLTLYQGVSGYGEKYLRPLLCAVGLLLAAAFFYLYFGVEATRWNNQKETLSLWRLGDWLQAAHYSFQVMTFLKSDAVLVPLGYARVVRTIESLLGPLFLGLFALAVRQRLKR